MSRIDDFFEAVERSIEDKTPDRQIALATVEPLFSQFGAARVTFDGETALSTKSYRTVGSVSAGDRVVMLRTGGTWVVLGPINPSIRMKTIHVGSLNSILDSGFYEAAPGAVGTPDSGAWWKVIVFGHTNPFNQLVTQIASAFYDRRMFQRVHTGGGTDMANGWTPWEPVAGHGDTAQHIIGAANEIPYLNGHSSYDYGGTARYFKNGQGAVSIQGLVTKAANASAVFNLPVGYRPSTNLIFPSWTSGLGAIEARLETNGNFYYNNTGASAWASVQVTYIAGN